MPLHAFMHACRYDRTNTFRRMDDCLFVAAMGPPGGGRNNITPRYARHFNLISIVDFDNTTLKRIFSNILDWALITCVYPANVVVRGGCGKWCAC